MAGEEPHFLNVEMYTQASYRMSKFLQLESGGAGPSGPRLGLSCYRTAA